MRSAVMRARLMGLLNTQMQEPDNLEQQQHTMKESHHDLTTSHTASEESFFTCRALQESQLQQSRCRRGIGTSAGKV